MNTIRLAALSAILAAMGATAQAQQPAPLRIAVEGAFAPYNFKDASGKLIGFEIELIPEFCKRMRVECTVIEQAWSGIIPGLQSGKYDAIVSSMTVTETRKKAVLFSDEYAINSVTFAALKSSPLTKLQSTVAQVDLSKSGDDGAKALEPIVEALKGKTVGANRSTTNENLANYLFKDKDTSVRSYDNSENVALDLMNGRVDAVVISRAQLGVLMKRSDQVVGIGAPIHGGLLGGGMAAAVRQDNQPLADAFSKAIRETITDGVIERLSVKWLGYDVTPKPK